MNPNVQQYKPDLAIDEHAERDELFVQTMNHWRHDWMNDIQVLYGYLKMKKYDKMVDYVETIKQKAARESGISRLGVPSLIVYLLSFRARCRSIRLDVELGTDVQLDKLELDAEQVAETIVTVVESFVRHETFSPDGGANRLLMTLTLGTDVLAIRFDYKGGVNEVGLRQELLMSGIAHRVGSKIIYQEDGAALQLEVPLGG